MPKVARVNDTIENNHLCDANSKLAGTVKSNKIEVNGKKVSLEGDIFTAHTLPAGPSCVPCPTTEFSATYSSKVEWEGKKCLAVGDVSGTHKISVGSEDVVVGS